MFFAERFIGYLKDGNTKQTLKDKYLQTIKNENGENTNLYKLDTNNPFLDKLLGQHDFKKENPSIDKWGCNFMVVVAVPQLLTGNIFNKKQILEIWEDSISAGWLENNAYVKEPDRISDIIWTKTNDNYSLEYTSAIKEYYLAGNRIRIPYNNTESHFTLGDNDKKIIYNPGYHIGNRDYGVNIYLRP